MRWVISVSIFLLVALSCGPKNVRYRDIKAGRLVKKDDISLKISEAKSLYDAGEIDGAISTLRVFLDTNPYHPSHDQAYELMVDWLLQLKRIKEAKRVTSHFLSDHPQSKTAQTLIDLLDRPQMTDDEPNHNQEPEEKTESSTDDQEIVPFKLEQSAQRVEQEARLAMLQFHLGNFSQSLAHIDKAYPHAREPQLAQLSTLKQDIKEITTVDAKAVGVLLPLSGQFSAFGQRALEAIGIALKTPFNLQGQAIKTFDHDGLRIVIADSNGSALTAKVMVEQLVKQHHVAMIIGEITNEASLLAALTSAHLGVPILSLARHPQMFGLDRMIFVFNSSPAQQINSLATYAMREKGYKRFAILYPRHNYGMSMSKLFFDAIVNSGGIVSALEAYDAHETTFQAPIQKLIGKYYGASIKPIVDFDALFIPEFHKLALIVPALRQEDILVSNNPHAIAAYAKALKDKNPQYVQLLGPNSWHDQLVISKIAEQTEGAYFVDSVSFDSSDQEVKFRETFQKATSSSPTSLEVFAHDAVKLAKKVLKESASTMKNPREYIRDAIARFNGRVGLLSPFSFAQNGELNIDDFGFEIRDGAAHIVKGHHGRNG